MSRFTPPLAAGMLGLVLIAGAACSDSPASTASSETQAPATTSNAAAQPTRQTSVSQSTNELSTADLVKLAEPSVVRIETNSGVGTGFVVGEDGHILTNFHVVEGSAGRVASTIRVTMSEIGRAHV